jgi:hypothetical protein
MNNHDYKEAFREIKPSNKLNDKIVNQLLNNTTNDKAVHHLRYKIRLVAICIALISISSISVAASAWNLVDVFKGYFKEIVSNSNDYHQNGGNNVSAGEEVVTPITKPITKDSAFLNTAGAIIESTDTVAGLKLTARGIVGDDRALYVAIDVQTTDGQAFTKEQEDNLNSIHFQEVKLQIDHDVLGQYSNCTRIDDGTEKGKATFLIHDIISSNNIEDISGQQLTITLTNLLHTTNDLEDIGMNGNLYDIFTKYDKPDDEDYQFYSVRSDSNHTDEENKILEEYILERKSGKLVGDEFLKRRDELIKAGLLEPLYTLPETSTKTSFCTKYPKLEITNMGIKDNIFTFNIDLNGELDYQYLNTKHLALVNRKTGACVGTTMDIDKWEGDENGKLLSAHFVVFHTITSAEQLKNYYLAIGGYGAEDIINKGEWKLSFNLNYEDTSRSYAINKKATISGFTGSIKTIDISPLSMKISYQTDKPMNAENRALFEDNWSKSGSNICLIMKDGTKINYLSGVEDIQNNICTFYAMFPYVIDLDQIDKIVIDETQMSIN